MIRHAVAPRHQPKGTAMPIRSLVMLGAAVAVALAFPAAAPVAAAQSRAAAATLQPSEVSAQARQRVREVRIRQARQARRAPTRIVVRPRSYLDAGTEVRPGERKFTDYAIPPSYSALQVVAGPNNPAGSQNPRWPLPSAFDLPGRNNPAAW
jgi:Ni/Co efflux regulator RcnB